MGRGHAESISDAFRTWHVVYHGVDVVYKIDGLDGADACYHFAGIVGVSPDDRTLRELEKMAWGRYAQRRREMIEQSQLIWNLDGIDIERYVCFGQIESTGKGGPVQLNPELEAEVQAEVNRLRAENPNLPKLTIG